MEVSVWFKSRLKQWYISIPSNHNQYSTIFFFENYDGKQLQAMFQHALSAHYQKPMTV